MLSENKADAENDVTSVYYTFLSQFAFMILLPLAALFIFANINSQTLSYCYFYWALGFGAIILIYVLKQIQLSSFKSGNKGAGAFNVLNHDPESGLIGIFVPNVAKKLFGNQFRLFLITAILFVGALFAYSIVTQQSIVTISQSIIGQTAAPVVSFQAKETGRIILAIFPAAEAETLLVTAAAALLSSLLVYAFFRNQSRLMQSLVFLAGILLFITLIGYGIHTFRYSGSDIDFAKVLQFWFLGGILTIVTGSNVPFRVNHYINNFFVAAGYLLSSDVAAAVLFLVLVVLVVLLVITEVQNRRRVRATG